MQPYLLNGMFSNKEKNEFTLKNDVGKAIGKEQYRKEN